MIKNPKGRDSKQAEAVGRPRRSRAPRDKAGSHKPTGPDKEDYKSADGPTGIPVVGIGGSAGALGLLRENEGKLRLFVEHVPAAIAMLDSDMKYLGASHRWFEAYGVDDRDIIGRSHYEVFPDVPERWKEIHRRCLAGARERHEADPWVRADGSMVWVRWEIRPWYKNEKEVGGLIIFSENISDLKQAETELLRLNKALKALSDSSQALIGANDELKYLNELCDIIIEDCGYSMVWIGFAENDEAKSVRPVAHAGSENGYLETLHITWADTERGRGPTGMAIRTGKVVVCRNMLSDPAFTPWREQAISRGYASSIVFPLIAGDKVFGAVTIYSREIDPFTEGEVKLLTELADNLTYGIEVLQLRAAREKAEEALLRSRAELENLVKERTKNMADSEEQLRNLYVHLQSLREAERMNVAREIHDDLGQELTALKMDLSWIVSKLPDDHEGLREKLREDVDQVDQTIQAVKRLCTGLRPGVLDHLGLAAALEWQAAEFQKRTGIKCRVVFDPEDIEVDTDLRTPLFRIFQEALTNVLKHAKATEVKASFKLKNSSFMLEITDNGIGIKKEQLSKPTSFGLLGMRERVHPLGGKVTVRGVKNKGTTVEVTIPVTSGNAS